MRPAITLTLMLLAAGCVTAQLMEMPRPAGEAICGDLEQSACVYDLGQAG